MSWFRRVSCAVGVLAFLASAPKLEAQFAEGNSDRDGMSVPRFPVPGGSVSILNGGEGSVTIPLPVPPGIGGMAPKLTLRYSSGAADEGLGGGWSLDLGYPDAVRRVTRFGVPTYGANDVFTFNGQDLVGCDPVGPPPNPFCDQTRYRTRIDSFQKIERVGDGWVVREKTGTQLVYGDSADKRSEIGGKGTYAWHLSRVEDTFAKGIVFEYEGPADARRLKSIVYTVRSGAAAGQEQKVVLHWQGRPDPRRSSSYGGEVVQDQRLDRVETFSSAIGADPLRTYDLCYEGEPCSGVDTPLRGHSRLAVLLQTSLEGASLPDTRFRYQDRTPGWTEGGPLTPFGFVHQVTVNGLRATDTGIRLADVNGDGFVDMVRGRVPSQAPFERVYLHDGSTGWSPAPSWQVPIEFLGLNRLDGQKDLGVQLVDVNGDSLPDIVQSVDVIKLSVPSTTEQTVRKIWLNNGHGWDPAPDCNVPQPAGYCFPPLLRQEPGSNFPFREFHFIEITDDLWSYPGGAQLADVNGDGLPDLLTARESRRRLVYLNNGKDCAARQVACGWEPAPAGSWALPDDFIRHDNPGDTPVDNGLRLYDLNGDALPDLVRAYSDRDRVLPDGPTLEVRLNHGSGWSAPGNWTWPGADTPADTADDIYFGAVTRNSNQNKVYWDYGVQVVDVDGDRYADIVYRVGTGPGKVYLNDQSAGFVAVSWDVPVSMVAEIRDFSVGSHLVGNMDNGVRVVDADGDGLSDLVYGLFVNGTAQTPRTYLANPGQTDLLTEYGNPLGGRASITYGSVNGLGLPPAQMPFVRTIALSLTREAGLGDPALVESYQYLGGFYDWRGRDFRGFASVIDTRGDGSKRERGFYLDEGRKGIQRGEMLRDSDGKYYSAHPQNFSSTADADGVYRTLLTQELIVQFHQDDQGKWVRRSIDYTHDAYGNVLTTRESDWGRMVRVCGPPDLELASRGGAGRTTQKPPPDDCRDEFEPGAILRSTRNRYTAPNDALWIVGLNCAVERFEGDLLTPGNNPLATQELYYEGSGSLCAQASQDRLTRDVLVDHRLQGLTLAIGSPTVSRGYGHDEFGNVTTETNARGYSTTIDYTGNGHLFAYRTCQGTFCRTTLYDRGQGVLLEDTDINGNTTRYSYDGLGRMRTRRYPDDPAEDPGLEVTYQIGSLPAYMRVTERLDDTRTRYRYEFFDGLGRPRAVAAGNHDFTVSGFTFYDDRGRRARVHEPFFCSEREPSDCVPGAAPFTTYEFEDDKISVVTLPGSPTARHTYEYEADGVSQRDENGVRTVKRQDGLGRLTEVTTDADGSGTTHKTTRYSYDGLGGLSRSVDPVAEGGRGVETRYFYDARGLLRGLSAPEGTQSLRNGYRIWNDYDAQGNHAYHWSGSDVWLATYDFLDRQTRLYVSRDTGVNYFAETARGYDFGPNGKGRVTVVAGYGPPVTWSQLFYDVRGRVTTEKFYFQNLDAALNGVTVAYEYDRENKVSAVRDPRGRLTRYARNVLGQIDKSLTRPAIHYNEDHAKGIPDLDYDPSGRTTVVKYGNGLTDIYAYHPRGRMEEILGDGPVQASYHYDLAGNLLNETRADGSTAVDYLYDRLRRLTNANGTIGQRNVALTWRYDASGNLEAVTGSGATNISYRYAPATNRLEAIRYNDSPEIAVRHDQHGNLSELQDDVLAVYSRTYTYDGLSRLKRYDTEQLSGSMAYGGYGRKVQRARPGGSEVYFHTLDGQVLATYEIAGAQRKWTTYLYAGRKRVASVGDQDEMSYFHNDRLGSPRAITADGPGPCRDAGNDPVVCRLDYLPYGEGVNSPRGADAFRFTGQELEADIYDFGARYYDPVLGRFLQIDSYLGDPADPRTLNRYSYALNNPLGYVDPTGHNACEPDDTACLEEEKKKKEEEKRKLEEEKKKKEEAEKEEGGPAADAGGGLHRSQDGGEAHRLLRRTLRVPVEERLTGVQQPGGRREVLGRLHGPLRQRRAHRPHRPLRRRDHGRPRRGGGHGSGGRRAHGYDPRRRSRVDRGQGGEPGRPHQARGPRPGRGELRRGRAHQGRGRRLRRGQRLGEARGVHGRAVGRERAHLQVLHRLAGRDAALSGWPARAPRPGARAGSTRGSARSQPAARIASSRIPAAISASSRSITSGGATRIVLLPQPSRSRPRRNASSRIRSSRS